MEADGVKGHQYKPGKEKPLHYHEKYFVPPRLIGFADSRHALRQQSGVVPLQPSG
jgi:hypothetical protein